MIRESRKGQPESDLAGLKISRHKKEFIIKLQDLVSIQKLEISGWSGQPFPLQRDYQLDNLSFRSFCPAMAGLKADR